MTDHKFTDDDIKTGLRCLSGEIILCKFCAFSHLEDRGFACKKNVANAALAFINRQKAEIERLNTVHADMTESLRLAAEANKDMSVELDAMRGAANSYKMHYEEAELKYQIAVAEREANVEGFIETLKTIKAEAIKEFAEKLKEKAFYCERTDGKSDFMVAEMEIDTLVKEMTEEAK